MRFPHHKGENVISHLDRAIPVAGICNIGETFYEFLSRERNEQARANLIKGELYRGDRALVWFGDDKLVFVSFPTPHAEALYHQCGYRNTRWLAPQAPTPMLSLDILREPALLDALVAHAGPGRTIQLVPYATTPEFLELADVLRAGHGLTVLLPETPASEAVWVRDYVDTKVGYRVLASRWLSNADELIPEGYPCHTPELAAQAAAWFSRNGRACLVKADTGENGIGNRVIRPAADVTPESVLRLIDDDAFLGRRWLTVEALVEAENPLSPSLEIYVPPAGQGDPAITYLSDQLFQGFGDFCGVLISRELNAQPWASVMAEAGLCIGRHLQAMGYVGHFDLDAVVDDDERVWLLEVNSRRTGGTHVHEFAHYVFGPDYLDRVALLSNDAMKAGAAATCDDLLRAVGDLAYPVDGQERGVVITITSALEAGEFGCIVVGADTADVVALQRRLMERLRE